MTSWNAYQDDQPIGPERKTWGDAFGDIKAIVGNVYEAPGDEWVDVFTSPYSNSTFTVVRTGFDFSTMSSYKKPKKYSHSAIFGMQEEEG